MPIQLTSNLKVALVYDKVNTWGGAERVLLALHDIFPEAPLYTSVYKQPLASLPFRAGERSDSARNPKREQDFGWDFSRA